MVLVGRATLYGTACGGQAGAARAIKILAGELERTFGYVGARSVSEIGPHIFAHHTPAMNQVSAPPATEMLQGSGLRVRVVETSFPPV
jgi:isopentenyl diphosphate isomerase/L-lactate dehydrogenase-like FMN-dependent dehydrogenase